MTLEETLKDHKPPKIQEKSGYSLSWEELNENPEDYFCTTIRINGDYEGLNVYNFGQRQRPTEMEKHLAKMRAEVPNKITSHWEH